MSEQGIYVGFATQPETLSFSATCGALPRVGDEVCYIVDRHMSAAQRAEWDIESLEELEALRDKMFRVVKVNHEIRKSGTVMSNATHNVWCEIEEVDPTEPALVEAKEQKP